MKKLWMLYCLVAGHRWSVTHVGPYGITNYGRCLRCDKKAG